ncbi:MAG: MBL fold metallo-hydrolase [Planctomycetota bacterium]|nr:MBL fold metallo-hydrolase [Planctomycetota bacterium]
MQIEHLNLGTLHALGSLYFPQWSRSGTEDHLICHSLLIDHPRGLTVVDTGFGQEDLRAPKERLGRGFLFMSNPQLSEEELLIRQLETRGISPDDLQHIVLTHMDLDHAGALPDFPRTRVHVHATEFEAAHHPSTWMENKRYQPLQWDHGPQWRVHDQPGTTWMGIPGAQPIDELDGDVLLIPLPGHTRGLCGVAIRLDKGWLLHAGDSYFHRLEIDPNRSRMAPSSAFFHWLLQVDGPKRRESLGHLRRLARDHADEIEIFSAHDPSELAPFLSR